MDKIDKLIEENEDKTLFLAMQAQGISPERKKELQGSVAKMKSAAKTGLKNSVAGAIGGGIGGGIVGGLPGAAVAAPLMGAAVGLGRGVGTYVNIKKAVEMSPADIKKYVKKAEAKWGTEISKIMKEAGGKI